MKGGMTQFIMAKTPPSSGVSKHRGRGQKNLGGKGKEKGSMFGRPPRQRGRKINGQILKIVQAYYEGTLA